MRTGISSILLFALACFTSICSSAQGTGTSADDGKKERQYCVGVLTRIADPVLNALSKNQLRSTMPFEGLERQKPFTHLEAFGRLLSGMAPWLELGSDNTPEGKLRKKYID